MIRLKLCRVAAGQEMARETENSSRSGKSQGTLFWVRKIWHFEEKSGKIKIIYYDYFDTIKC